MLQPESQEGQRTQQNQSHRPLGARRFIVDQQQSSRYQQHRVGNERVVAEQQAAQ